MNKIPRYPNWQLTMFYLGLVLGFGGLFTKILGIVETHSEFLLYISSIGFTMVWFSLWRGRKIHKLRKKYLEN